MDANDHRNVMAQLDALRQQVATTIRKFEATGMTSILKDDYVALHDLEHRIMEMHRVHAREVDGQQEESPSSGDHRDAEH